MQEHKIKLPIKGTVEKISEVTGLFDDLWVGKNFNFTLQSKYPIQEVGFKGYISSQFSEGNSFILKVGRETKTMISSEGDQVFNCSISVMLSAYQKTQVEIISKKVYNPKNQGFGEDTRDLCFILIEVYVHRSKTAAEYLQEGQELQKKSHLQTAMTYYTNAINLNPAFPWSYYLLGSALARQGQYQDAITHYYKAIELNSNSALFYHSLAEALNQQGDKQKAFIYLEKALEIDPKLTQLSIFEKLKDLLTKVSSVS